MLECDSAWLPYVARKRKDRFSIGKSVLLIRSTEGSLGSCYGWGKWLGKTTKSGWAIITS